MKKHITTVSTPTTSSAIVQSLRNHNITEIFGYPGAAICPFYDALYKFNKQNQDRVNHILVRQEQNAGHAASGYARISGRASVCVATSGPGALNLIPAIACAYMDSIPMIIITGQVSSELLGRDVFQEADITGCAEPFVKHSYLVRNGTDIMKIMDEAFYIANTGRKGPVLIDIPVDVLESKYKKSICKDDEIGYLSECYRGDNLKNPTLQYENIERAKSALCASKRPLLCVGGGIFSADAQKELLEFIEYCNIPFVCTMMGISAISPRNSHFLGMLGDYGVGLANDAVLKCDMLFLIGARAGDRAIKSDKVNSKIICHIDIDPCELNKNMEVDIQINLNVKNVLPAFSNLKELKKQSWTDNIKIEKGCVEYDNENSPLFRLIFSKLSQNAIIISDVGRHLIYCAHEYNLENGRFLASGGMGTMGYAIPAAIGASLAAKDRQVIVFCGDGGFQMSFMELATIKRESLPIKIILLDNHCLGLVKELQDIHYNKNEIAVSLEDNPDFCVIASAYGIPCISIKKTDDDSEKAQKTEEFLSEDTASMLICEI